MFENLINNDLIEDMYLDLLITKSKYYAYSYKYQFAKFIRSN